MTRTALGEGIGLEPILDMQSCGDVTIEQLGNGGRVAGYEQRHCPALVIQNQIQSQQLAHTDAERKARQIKRENTKTTTKNLT